MIIAATPSSGCVSLINPNTQYSASSSSAGPGKPVLHGDDVWCAGIDDQFQFLTVNLGKLKHLNFNPKRSLMYFAIVKL